MCPPPNEGSGRPTSPPPHFTPGDEVREPMEGVGPDAHMPRLGGFAAPPWLPSPSLARIETMPAKAAAKPKAASPKKAVKKAPKAPKAPKAKKAAKPKAAKPAEVKEA